MGFGDCIRFGKLKKSAKLVIMFIVLMFLFDLDFFVVADNKFSIDEGLKNESDFNSYIVKFNGKCLSSIRKEFKEKLAKVFFYFSNKVMDKVTDEKFSRFKNKILSLHSKAKEDISNLFNDGSEAMFGEEFLFLFNGITLNKVSNRAVDKIRGLPYVDGVYPDDEICVCLDDSIPLIGADDVWSLNDSQGRSVTGKDISVAVLDTGIDYTHPVLESNYAGGYDFVNDDPDPMDDNGHGTHVSGIVAGAAPDVDIYAFKVMDNKGEGRSSVLIKGMEKAVDPNNDGDFSDHLDIISISAGDPSGHPYDPLSSAADNAVDAGVVVVAAAGNDGPSEGTVSSPGNARKVICVGASYKNDQVVSSSSRGPTSIGTVKPDLMAPGVHIRSTWVGGGYKKHSGTSMACPHVAGTAALILQMHPNWIPVEIKMGLRNTAVDLGYDINVQGYGRINAFEAVSLQSNPPISILSTSGEINNELVNIYGTASAEDLQSYILYYQQYNEWIKFYEGNKEVENNVLFIWNVGSLDAGVYKLKLEVESKNQQSIDIVYISIKIGKKLIIESPDEISELERFTIDIKDYTGNSKMAWVLFTVPFHRPKVSYGSSVNFRAPLILRSNIAGLAGKIRVFRIFGGYKVSEKDVFIVND